MLQQDLEELREDLFDTLVKSHSDPSLNFIYRAKSLRKVSTSVYCIEKAKIHRRK
jgi:hypothetical protein